jgi:hypothetical protein
VVPRKLARGVLAIALPVEQQFFCEQNGKLVVRAFFISVNRSGEVFWRDMQILQKNAPCPQCGLFFGGKRRQNLGGFV